MHILRHAPSLALVALLAGCAFDEGINVHDMSGTVLVPKSAAPTADSVGMIYVGLYSGIDNHLGYPSPIAAPAASTASADTFPYGGASIGSFYLDHTTSNPALVCQVVSSRSVRDADSDWALDFEILQFPFYEGTSVWAWMDTFVTSGDTVLNGFTSCDPNNGYYDSDSGYFGSQFQDVLNYPGKYIRGINGASPGDFVAETPYLLESLSGDVEVTIAFEVP